MAALGQGAGWEYGWADPYTGGHDGNFNANGATRATSNMSATIAPETTRVEGFEWVVITSIVLLILTICGALMILVSMAWLEYRGRPATTRTRLVQALVVSDLILGIVGLIGNVIDITPGHRLTAGTSTCNGLGFVLLAVLWTEHVWTLCLAIGTYLILIHPLHTATLVLEKHWIWLWAFVWLSAIAVALITQLLYGFQPSGGICYYPQSAGLYSELMQFIPRAVVFIGITLLYARLYVFLKRPDKIRSPYSNSPTGGQSYDSSLPKRKLNGFLRKFSGGEKGSGNATPTIPPNGRFERPDGGDGDIGIQEKITPEITPPSSSSPYPQPQPQTNHLSTAAQPRGGSAFSRGNLPHMASDDPLFSSTTFRPSSAPVSPATEIPPWERLELPVFQIDGQRYGGPSGFSGNNGGSGGGSGFGQTQQGIFGGWKGLNSKKRPSTANSSGSVTPATPGFGSGSPAQHHSHRMGSTSAGGVAFDAPGGGSSRSRQPSGETSTTSNNGDPRRKLSSNATTTTANTTTNLLPSIQRRPSAILRPDTSPVLEQGEMEPFGSNYPSTINAATLDTRRERVGGGSGTDFDSDLNQSRRPSQRHEEGDRDRDDEDDDEEEDGENEMDLLRMLRQDPEPQGGETRDDYELVPESMASYLNRKTALLMLWFPLGYVLLFSISLIRVIYDFVGQPPTVLRAMSRWFVFAQGLLDALIYGLVEWHTKRVVRRRVRKGALSPGGSRGEGTNSGLATALRSLNFRRSAGGTGTGIGTGSGIGSGSNTPQLASGGGGGGGGRSKSRPRTAGSTNGTSSGNGYGAGGGNSGSAGQIRSGGRFPSILQELKLESDTPRKGSVATTVDADESASTREKGSMTDIRF